MGVGIVGLSFFCLGTMCFLALHLDAWDFAFVVDTFIIGIWDIWASIERNGFAWELELFRTEFWRAYYLRGILLVLVYTKVLLVVGFTSSVGEFFPQTVRDYQPFPFNVHSVMLSILHI